MIQLCNACTIWLKLDCLNPNVQRWNRTLAGSAPETDANESHEFEFCSW
jgi:hypothetical protein